jgi:hypothetical protein
MAAMLERNDAGGRPIADPGLPAHEIVSCTENFCHHTFTLAYGIAENRIEETQNALDVIRRTAVDRVRDDHPHLHGNDTYVWGGITLGWLDRERATAAGL